MLFAIYLDDLLITLQKQKPDDSSYTNCLAYADDLVLITRTKEDLKRLLKTIEKWCEENSMTVNTGKGKSAIMPLGKTSEPNNEFQIHNKPIDITNTYKYIGFLITKNGKWETHINKTITKARGLLTANARFLTDKSIPVKIRLDAGKILILSTLKYGENVIKTPGRLKAKMESVQTQMNRMILGMPRSAKAAAMRLMLGLPTLDQTRKIARTKYLQKVSKLTRDRLIKQVFIRSKMETTNFEETEFRQQTRDNII